MEERRLRILLVTARFPASDGKGDQVRSLAQIERLAARHEVTVLTPGPPPSADAARRLQALARLHVVTTPTPRRALGAVAALARGRPAELGWFCSPTLRRALRRLAPAHDVVFASTLRPLAEAPAAPLVLDHIDALSLNLRRRADGPEPLPLRLGARLESVLLARHERRTAGWAAQQIVTAREDAGALPPSPPPHVIPQGWVGEVWEEPADHVRDLDVIFTGTMSYPPNVIAARWVERELAPALTARRPGTRVVVAGRRAAGLGLTGVEVLSDVPDLGEVLRRAKVAVVPLGHGTGSPNKLLEAAVAGCAVVASSWAAERFEVHCEVADGAAETAAEVLALLEDAERRRASVGRTRATLPGAAAPVLMERLERVVEQAAAPGP